MSPNTALRAFTNGWSIEHASIPLLDQDAFAQVILDAVAEGQRVVALFGAQEPDAVALYVVLANDEENLLAAARTLVTGGGFASLTPRCPQVHLFEREIKPLADPVQRVDRPLFIAVNKTDRVRPKEKLLPFLMRVGQSFPGAEIFPLSAATGDGVDTLLGELIKILPAGEARYPEDQLSTASMRFLAAETIREKLFLELEQELPYSTIVEIEQWEEPEPIDGKEGPVRINAAIHVARTTHKGMVIGKGGQLLKKIGTAARIELEVMLERPVHLELWVRVREDWTEDTAFLREMGLGE